MDEVLVNLHHLPDVVRDHLAARTGAPAVANVVRAGTARQRGHARSRTGSGSADEEFFLACNADNLTDFDLRILIKAHREQRRHRDLGRLPLADPVRRRRRGRQMRAAPSSASPRSRRTRSPTW